MSRRVLVRVLRHCASTSVRTLTLAVCLVSLGSPVFAGSLTLVVPNGLTSTIGNTTDSLDGTGNFHVQEIYGSGQFLSVGSPLLIDQLAFRAYPGTGAVNATIADLEAHLSTTPYFPNLNGGPGLLITNNFATNLGPDNTLVYSGPATLASPGCAVNGSIPCPFDIVFNFITPFWYDPTKGRLLLDLMITGFDGSLNGGKLDAVDFSFLSPPYGSVASIDGLLGDSTGEFSAGGNITQFRYTPVPEPASLTLVLSGIGAVAAMRRRRRNGMSGPK